MDVTFHSFFDAWGQLLASWQRTEDFGDKTLTFLSLTLRGLGVVLLLGIPAGVALTRLPRVATPVIAVLALLQTIPSLALVGLLLPLVGIGTPAAIFAAVFYSLFPVVLNTYVGISEVSPAVRDAARGMGMTGRQILWHVEFPLALPMILAGVRTGAVSAIGIITIAALVGAGGLGDYIVTGMTRGDAGSVYLGVLPILLITFVVFWGLGGLARLARRHNDLGLLLGGGLIGLLAGYAALEPFVRPRRPDVIVGAKNFTEGAILSEIFRLLLQAHTDLSVEVKHNLGSKTTYQALLSGDIDVYPEYTGNLLTAKDALNHPVPSDKGDIYPLVKQQMLERYHIVVLEPLGLNNVYVPCTTRAIADKYGLRKTSDLRHVPQLRVVIDLEFIVREDGWPGFVKKYDLHFQRPPIQTTPDLMYNALEAGEAEVVIGFATDARIVKYGLVTLEDDRGYFPTYHAIPVLRETYLKDHPEVGAVLNKLAGRIDDATMRRLNYQVDVEHRSPVEVARTFLEQQGLLK
jgi:osmoprotectant transport system permease protein